MEMNIFDTSDQLDDFAAKIYVDTLNNKPNAVLGLATGSTPIGIYNKLVREYEQKRVSFANVKTYNLDEYVGLPPDHEQSYAYYMNKHLFSQVDIPSDQVSIPNGMALDPQEECRRYNTVLAANPADIQLLGLGHNGHIGFNEPDQTLMSETHVVSLKEETREANARFFTSIEEVPTHAYTMGMSSILKATTILLVVRGSDKANIVKEALTGPITTQIPASLLQTHPRVIVLLDQEAGRMIRA